MDFLKLVELRQSDRKFIDKDIEEEKLARCLETARLAPSASNSQPWTFIVINDKNLKDEVAYSTYGPLKSFNKFVPQSNIIIAIVQEKKKILTEIGGRIKDKDYALMDIGIAAEHICLAAAEEGIGSCMLGWFDEKKVKQLLKVPENKNIPLLIALGYTPDDYKHRKKTRKQTTKVIKYNSY
ncbi:MAG: NAD(P)H nitroreductase [Marinilabiliales bacterium]|nr:MAG: NAD(P)H nitroreductase [Marinilabiliales bacterium]